jgi:hypothetical protein
MSNSSSSRRVMGDGVVCVWVTTYCDGGRVCEDR